MLEAATLGGARALHWDDRIGSLEPGKAADLIAVNLATIQSIPVQDPAAQLLYAAGRENITHTWVNGRLIAIRQEIVAYHDLNAVDRANSLAGKWQNRL